MHASVPGRRNGWLVGRAGLGLKPRMNYRHAFHAGNFADVVKHAVLALLLDHLCRKDTPFALFDMHAGVGLYDLWGDAAGRTGEWQDGITRALAEPLPPGLGALAAAVAEVNQPGELRFYPGSPLVAQRALRPGDRLVLAELHPEDARSLRGNMRGDSRVAVHQRDAYEALKGLLPPPERRGLVLIDPPFEEKDEFARIQRGLAQAVKRWANGIYVVWYPIKDRPPVAAFHAELAALPVSEILVAELLVHPDDYPARLNGCGLAILNPPWKLDETLAELMPELHRRMARSGGGARVEWLKRSAA
jgi:23S rRNA (adenine2030-N6)-methyltransferase